MKNYLWSTLALMVAIILIFTPGALAQTEDEPVVHAVLFFSPTCPHCHDVINNLLVPMIEEHGDRLQIMGVDVSQEDGQTMYQMAIEQYQIPPNRLGVPTMIVADRVLVGSVEIPGQFPQIVADGLAGSGIGWPAIPGLIESLAAQAPAATAEAPVEQAAPEAAAPAEESAATAQPAAAEKPAPAEAGETASTGGNAAAKPEPAPEETAAEASTSANSPTAAPATEAPQSPRPESGVIALDENNIPEVAAAEVVPPPDPIGISLAGLVLGGMLFALFFAARALSLNANRLFELSRIANDAASSWLIPALALAGLVVSGYLAYVEITHTEAICGPVGNCNAVQSSPYAVIAGVPIAVLGLLNYAAVMVLWLGIRFGKGQVADLSLLGLLVLALVGVIFSVYLTALEIFIIQAVCAWCITSAIITTAILLIVATSIRVPPTQRALPA